MTSVRTFQPTQAALADAVRASWDVWTSANDDWSPDVPSAGQCAVTALVVQDWFGGDLMRAVVQGQSHYWNRIDGVDFDLTRDQFSEFVPSNEAVRDRAYVLSYPATAKRYELLRDRVRRLL